MCHCFQENLLTKGMSGRNDGMRERKGTEDVFVEIPTEALNAGICDVFHCCRQGHINKVKRAEAAGAIT